mmetsp:Transcript_5601/g.16509  ORF Transcript_5601/g.16509 Transcript_5601/m.16509 type:complete len:206 (-) Transcript_5601:1853-2470(-)
MRSTAMGRRTWKRISSNGSWTSIRGSERRSTSGEAPGTILWAQLRGNHTVASNKGTESPVKRAMSRRRSVAKLEARRRLNNASLASLAAASFSSSPTRSGKKFPRIEGCSVARSSKATNTCHHVATSPRSQWRKSARSGRWVNNANRSCTEVPMGAAVLAETKAPKTTGNTRSSRARTRPILVAKARAALARASNREARRRTAPW